MFTQCPKCQSVFMVSDKDIKAHEGLVRCGNCYSVFNSSWNLTDDPRNDFVEEPASASTTGLPGSQSSGFTFSIVDNAVNAAAATAEQPEEGDKDETGPPVHQEDSAADEAEEYLPATGLEPFPEPDRDDLPATLSETGINEEQESLLYFDTNEIEDDEEAGRGVAQIEDLTILQMPSFTSEIPSSDQTETIPEHDSGDEPVMGSLTAESMWPGSEAEFENDEAFELPTAGSDEDEVDASGADIEVSQPVLPDDEAQVDAPIMVEPSAEILLEEDHVVDSPSTDEPLLKATTEDAGLADVAAEAEITGSKPSLESFAEEASSEQLEEVSKSLAADDTFSATADVADADEFFSLDALPEMGDEALHRDGELEDVDESVFITSEEEEIDEAYIPISLKSDQQDELFHGLEEFPEPGELSAQNLEDTMEINAMLEEANISKEQIESALSAAEIGDEENGINEDAEEILLSSDADVDLTEALFSSDGDDEREPPATEGRKKDRISSSVNYFKNLMPLGMGQKKAWKEPAIADDQTQLIQSLNRGRNKPELPAWVGKYSLIAAISVLIVILLGQIGYFYMDKLVRITPLRPLLVAGCGIAGCTVPEIQNISAIEQLSSRLTPLSGGDGGFKVSSILVNRGIRSQSFPALELTLTDRAGNMISRRVISRDRYLTKEQPAMMMPNEAVDINIRFRTPSIRVDGFELRPVSQNWLERSK